MQQDMELKQQCAELPAQPADNSSPDGQVAASHACRDRRLDSQATTSSGQLPQRTDASDKDGHDLSTPSVDQAKLDFAKYHRPELTERIRTLLSVTQSLATVVRGGVVCLLLFWLSVPLLALDHVAWTWTIALTVYGSVATAFVGILLGAAIALNRSLTSVVQIIDLSLDLSVQASHDMGSVLHGKTTVPSPPEVAHGIHENVILPILKGVLTCQWPRLGLTAFKLYRWSASKIMDRVARGIMASRDFQSATPLEPGIGQQTLSGAHEVAVSITEWLHEARRRVTGAGHGLRRLLMVPTLFIVVATALVVYIPFLLLLRFAT